MTNKTTHDLARELLAKEEVPLNEDGEPMQFIVNTFRNYWRGDDKTHATNFIKDGDRWLCTHGSWHGEVKDGNELVLHHHYGKAVYDHYEEYTEMEEV